MQVPIGDVVYEVDFTFKEGTDTSYSPMYGADGGDAAECTIQHVYIGESEIPHDVDLWEKIEVYICENYIPDDYGENYD